MSRMATTKHQENAIFHPLQFVQGDIFKDAPYKSPHAAIVVSSTATGARSYGLLKNIEYNFPYVKFHPGRSCEFKEYYMTASEEEYKTPGSLSVYNPIPEVDEDGPVIYGMVSRIVPGNAWPHNAYARELYVKKRLNSLTLSLVKLDTEASRRMWFLEALKNLENEIGINKQVKNIYFPSGTGSGTNDPFWINVCLPMLAAFAKTMHTRQVRVYVVSRNTYGSNENTGKTNAFNPVHHNRHHQHQQRHSEMAEGENRDPRFQYGGKKISLPSAGAIGSYGLSGNISVLEEGEIRDTGVELMQVDDPDTEELMAAFTAPDTDVCGVGKRRK